MRVAPSSPISLLLLICSHLLRSAVGLRCSVCRRSRYLGVGPHQSEIDRLRMAFNIPRPYCRLLDEVVCDRDQDICVTITSNMAPKGYWIAMGCSQRHQFPQKSGCERIKQDTRSTSFDAESSGRLRIHENRAVQEICVCSFNNCNGAGRLSPSLLSGLLLLPAFLSLHS